MDSQSTFALENLDKAKGILKKIASYFTTLDKKRDLYLKATAAKNQDKKNKLEAESETLVDELKNHYPALIITLGAAMSHASAAKTSEPIYAIIDTLKKYDISVTWINNQNFKYMEQGIYKVSADFISTLLYRAVLIDDPELFDYILKFVEYENNTSSKSNYHYGIEFNRMHERSISFGGKLTTQKYSHYMFMETIYNDLPNIKALLKAEFNPTHDNIIKQLRADLDRPKFKLNSNQLIKIISEYGDELMDFILSKENRKSLLPSHILDTFLF